MTDSYHSFHPKNKTMDYAFSHTGKCCLCPEHAPFSLKKALKVKLMEKEALKKWRCKEVITVIKLSCFTQQQ